MTSQIVEITKPGYWLSKSRGFLEVFDKGERIGQVPFDDIVAVIISVPGCSITTVLMDRLSQLNIPLVICGQNYLPSSFMLPVQGYSKQFKVMRSQTELSEPRRKRAWQSIVKAKIRNQAEVLERVGRGAKRLWRLEEKVRSGDIDNCEAQAARVYWQQLFDHNFRRNQSEPGLNSALNYIYAIVRACVARGVVSAGLHPSFSLHHKNARNPLNLVDDLMEPFRPIADYLIWKNGIEKYEFLDPQNKPTLAAITTLCVPIAEERGASEISPVSLAAVKICRSFASYCQGERDTLLTPFLPEKLELAAA